VSRYVGLYSIFKLNMRRYNLFDGIIKARQAEDRREEDALQVLLELGDSTADVIQVRDPGGPSYSHSLTVMRSLF
jgi:hypothetical protein